jgi:membrane protease YdiL (CAAX protease family)
MRARLAVLLEVLGVYLAGQLVMVVVLRVAGIAAVNPLTTLTVDVSGPDLVRKTHELVRLLVFQYVGWFLLILPVALWKRSASPRVFGFTKNGHGWGYLAIAGIVAWAIAELPTRWLEVLNSFYQLGETTPWRRAVFDMSWRRWEFWYFSAMGSYLLIPVLEELFYRGYCQRRLAQAWGDGPAIIGVSALFAFSHAQYLRADLYNVGMLLGVVLGAVGFGIVFAATRSLWPSVIAHALVNIPMTRGWMMAVGVVMAVIAWRTWRPAMATTRQVVAGLSWPLAGILAGIGAIYAVAAARVEALVLVAVALLAIGVALQVGQRQLPAVRTS